MFQLLNTRTALCQSFWLAWWCVSLPMNATSVSLLSCRSRARVQSLFRSSKPLASTLFCGCPPRAPPGSVPSSNACPSSVFGFFLLAHGISFLGAHSSARKILAGLIFSALGDAFLIWQEQGYFSHGELIHLCCSDLIKKGLRVICYVGWWEGKDMSSVENK